MSAYTVKAFVDYGNGVIVLNNRLCVLAHHVGVPALQHYSLMQDFANIFKARYVGLWMSLAVSVGHSFL